MVSLVSRHVVFEPDVAELSARGRDVVDTLAPVLRTLTDPLSIDGHTNQVKVKPKYYPTDWELSAARAVGVLRYLHSAWHVPSGRLTATNLRRVLFMVTLGSATRVWWDLLTPGAR